LAGLRPPPGSRREPRWVPGAHNPSTIECVSTEANGLRGLFCRNDGPWPANAEMSLRRRILGSRLRGWTDQRDREPFALQSAFGGRPYQSGDEVAFSVRVCGDGDNEGRRFSVDAGDQGESEGGVGSQDENDGVASLRGLLRRSLPVERAHQEAEVEAGELSQIR
jgi:hypothetical protein